MSLHVKAGTPKGVHSSIAQGVGKEEVREYSDSPAARNKRKVSPYPNEAFLEQMEEGFSPGETNQMNPFEFPAAVSTKPRTFSEAVQELTLRFKLMMVACWLPKDYRVLPPQMPMPNPMMVDLSLELKAIATKLWDSYEPRLGVHNAVAVLQVEAPPEEDE
jgi:hypothetical protein